MPEKQQEIRSAGQRGNVSIEDARCIADKVIKRALADAKFREQLKGASEKTLIAAGLTQGPIEDIQREMSIDGRSLANDCTVTCISTCWYTCIFSLW